MTSWQSFLQKPNTLTHGSISCAWAAEDSWLGTGGTDVLEMDTCLWTTNYRCVCVCVVYKGGREGGTEGEKRRGGGERKNHLEEWLLARYKGDRFTKFISLSGTKLKGGGRLKMVIFKIVLPKGPDSRYTGEQQLLAAKSHSLITPTPLLGYHSSNCMQPSRRGSQKPKGWHSSHLDLGFLTWNALQLVCKNCGPYLQKEMPTWRMH